MKTERINLILQPEEKTAFQHAAQLSGISLSAWIRERLRSASIKELEDAGFKIPFLKPFSLKAK